MTAAIEIARKSQWVNRIREYTILLNDVRVGAIKDGENVRIDIEPGQHELQLTIDWCGSARLPFTIAEGEKLLFRTGCRIGGFDYFHPFTMLYYVLYKKNEYLYVKQEEIRPAGSIEIYIGGQPYEP
ncbi:hypothetical protein GZH47_01540 [Paenibacillus rhizovicinus]|uniref:Uncharacterized protein n=1 Tax=Paenibacillus rhizovicinus TaxID=2704463 RepID=A0A6C0NUN7_9BACL|nr:hypothetical protein [Paenibacillus rhizovicinus]QHW29646.1 hypothetical protein GZH47_01540 [Paenibacillus rhizovicinus]